MSTQALLDKITAASTEAVAQIEADAAKTVSAIKATTDAEVATITSDAQEAATKAAAAVKRAALAKARQAGKLQIQTARRAAFDAVMAEAKTAAVGDDAAAAQAWSDKEAELEMHVSKQIG